MQENQIFSRIPKYNSLTDSWEFLDFKTKKDHITFLKAQFKVPGKYGLKNTKNWIKPRLVFKEHGVFTQAIKNSKSYKKFWLSEGLKITNGVLFDDFFVPGSYYFYLNYCPIIIKHEGNRLLFPEVWDSDYHTFLYLELCAATGKFAVINKKRQTGFSYKMAALIILDMWFKKKQRIKAWTKGEKYIASLWTILNQFRAFIQHNTAWQRDFIKDDTKGRIWHMMWKDATNTLFGRDNELKGVNAFKETDLVGGYHTLGIAEEAGINDSLKAQVDYFMASISQGALRTGRLILGGSVGELKNCEDLRQYTYHPEESGFMGVEDIWIPGKKVSLFIPVQWNYIHHVADPDDPEIILDIERCYDDDGNSDVEKALSYIYAYRKSIEHDPGSYIKYCSQNPISLDELYSVRETNIFPTHIINPQYNWVEENVKDRTIKLEYNPEPVTSVKNPKDYQKLIYEETPLYICKDFPLRPTSIRESNLVINEFPILNNKPYIYFAGVDPVKNLSGGYGSSLMSCYIYQNYYTENGILKGGKYVAWYTGRCYDDNDTFNMVLKLCEFYNAHVTIESDESSFIDWMRNAGKAHMMFRRSQIPILKDLVPNSKIGDEYGLRMNTGGAQGSRVREYMYEKLVTYCQEVMGVLDLPDGRKQQIYGVERIKDVMLLKEMLNFKSGSASQDKFDRITAAGIALIVAECYRAGQVVPKTYAGDHVRQLAPMRIKNPSRFRL